MVRMRNLLHGSMHYAGARALLCWALLSNVSTGAQIPRQGLPGDASNHSQDSQQEDEQRHKLAEKLEKQRNEQRQQQLVKDTDKLLALATQLKADVSRTDKNVLSVDVVKRAEEIEKLAKSVKDRMRY